MNIRNVFRTFSDVFFPYIFCSHYSCVSGKIVLRVSPPPFFGHDIRVNIIKRFFALLYDDFFSKFLHALFVCIWKYFFTRFVPSIFGHDFRVNIKNHFSHFFRRFFQTFFARTIRMFLETLFSAYFSPHFLVTIFV